MNRIISSYDLDPIIWPLTFDSLNFHLIKLQINRLLKFVYHKCKYEEVE